MLTGLLLAMLLTLSKPSAQRKNSVREGGLRAFVAANSFTRHPDEKRADMPRVEKVENGGLLFTDNPAGISGMDCGYSLPLNGQTLWFCGDVFLLHPTEPKKPYVGGVSNGALLVPVGSGTGPLRRYTFLTDTQTGLARQVLPNEKGEG